jgi:hypothetical protein
MSETNNFCLIIIITFNAGTFYFLLSGVWVMEITVHQLKLMFYLRGTLIRGNLTRNRGNLTRMRGRLNLMRCLKAFRTKLEIRRPAWPIPLPISVTTFPADLPISMTTFPADFPMSFNNLTDSFSSGFVTLWTPLKVSLSPSIICFDACFTPSALAFKSSLEVSSSFSLLPLNSYQSISESYPHLS